MKQTRRDLLRHSACGLLGRAAFLSGFDRFSMVSAMAAPAADATDYKALVCIFLFGGNDANNMIVPLDNFANYATARGVLALTQAQLLQITTKGLVKYGLHPNLGSAQPNQTSLSSLFQSGALAVVGEVARARQIVLAVVGGVGGNEDAVGQRDGADRERAKHVRVAPDSGI